MNDSPARPRIPTNIITGFLGAGKTTVIRHVFASKPDTEKWAVLVNEFGEVGIDGAMLEQDKIAVKEVTGGCMCCAAGLPSISALKQLIDEQQPARILIEPTGLAAPQQILDQLQSSDYGHILDIQAIVCLLDPWSVSDAGFLDIPAFQQQLACADILVASKTDQATENEQRAFATFCEKVAGDRQVAAIQHGQLPWQWLTQAHRTRAHVVVHASHSEHAHSHSHHTTSTSGLVRKANQAEFGFSCGWQIPAAWRFNKRALLALLNELDIPRIKGLIHTSDGWLLLNRMRNVVSCEAARAQDQSQLEMIALEAQPWPEIEAQLIKTKLP